MIRFSLASLAVLITLAGCGDDGGTATDTGPGMDAATDTGSGDTGSGDSAPSDTSPGDTDVPDTSSDAGPVDTGPADTGPADAGPADTGADMCATAQRDAADFLAANKSCSVDADCVQASAECFGAEEACCAVYMADGYDTTAWDMLLNRMRACSGGACACCRALPPPPGCNSGVCGARGRP